MRKFKLVFVAASLATTGCSAPPHAQEAQAKADAKPKVGWQETDRVDPLSDEKQYFLSNEDQPEGRTFGLVCGHDGVVAYFKTGSFLGDQLDARIDYRIDEAKAEWGWIVTKKDQAMFMAPREWRDIPDELNLAYTTAGGFLAEAVVLAPHKRLRLRLTSFDGEKSDAEFDITGLHERWPRFKKDCDSL